MMCSFFHLFIYKELTLGWIFDTTQYIVSSKFIRVDQYFNFIIVNPKNTNLHKSIEQNGEVCFGPFQKYSMLIPSQNSFDDFFF